MIWNPLMGIINALYAYFCVYFTKNVFPLPPIYKKNIKLCRFCWQNPAEMSFFPDFLSFYILKHYNLL